jgi:25S rRNA (uracil2843-N3)-methyltransferase
MRDYLEGLAMFENRRTLAERSGQGKKVEGCTRAVCIGGGAAEVVAFGAAVKYLHFAAEDAPKQDEAESDSEEEDNDKDDEAKSLANAAQKLDITTRPILDLHLIDSADWSPVTSSLHHALTHPLPLSKYATAAARAANVPLIPSSSMHTTFHNHNVLDLSISALKAIVAPKDEPCLVTLLFTLNELYTASISKTTALLLKLTTVLPAGSVLLVIDSPGSYSEAAVGKAVDENGEPKKYPMSWLMDHALLPKQLSKAEKQKRKEDGEKELLPEWEKVVGEEARWFRLDEQVERGYPVSVENMRYQVHVFRKV